MNIPNWLTLLRFFTIPLFIFAFYLPFQWGPFACVIIFMFSAITDWLDGFLARRWNNTTRLGAFLDPVVDKIMVAMALMLAVEYFHSWLITLPAITIIARELIILALREWMAEIGQRSCVAVSWIGKTKTTAQMLALVALLWHPEELITCIGIYALYIATILTFFSMFQYLYFAQRNL